MAGTVNLSGFNIPTGIKNMPETFTIKDIDAPWQNFNKLFGIIEIDGKELYFLKIGDKVIEKGDFKSYFESNIFIPKGFNFVTGAELGTKTPIGGNVIDGNVQEIPQKHFLPLFIGNAMNTLDTNFDLGLVALVVPRRKAITISYKQKMKNTGDTGGGNPHPTPPEPNEGTATCVLCLMSSNDEIVVFYSDKDIPVHAELAARHPEADFTGAHYFIPTLMPDLALCLVVIPATNLPLVIEWAKYLNSLDTIFAGAIDPDVIPVDLWKCFVAFPDKVPNKNISMFEIETTDRKFKVQGASYGGIRFVENPNVKR